MILSLENVSFSFSTNNRLFNNLSFELEKGVANFLIGGNGSGKTTLFNIVNGFYRCERGSIKFKQKEISKLKPYQVNRVGIGRTFQDLRLIPKLSVRENLLLAFPGAPHNNLVKALLSQSLFSKKKKIAEDLADKLIDQFFLTDIRNSLAGEISFGQQKLLNLATCVANGAELILLDEPVAGVNPHYRDMIAELILKLKEQGKTFLIIEHNTDFIADIANKILYLHNGELLFFDTVNHVKNDRRIANEYY